MAMTKTIKINIPSEGDVKHHHQQQQSTKTFHPVLWNFMLISCVTIYGTYAVLIHLSKVDGVIQYSSAATVLLIELFKLVTSLVMYGCEWRRGEPFPVRDVASWKFVIPFAVPAVLYCCTNNISIRLQMYMDPATYQVLSNLKILSTAILYRLIMKRNLSWVQWLSLFILFVAACQNSIGSLVAEGDVANHSSSVTHITVKGIALILVYCTLSGLAGVYSEYILKDRFEVSINIQNSLLYIFGIILNGSMWFFSAWSDGEDFNLFKGFNVYVWIMIVLQMCVGLMLSLVMKHASNITRLFIISSAALLTTVLSVVVFGLELNFHFCVAFVLFVVSLGLYHRF